MDSYHVGGGGGGVGQMSNCLVLAALAACAAPLHVNTPPAQFPPPKFYVRGGWGGGVRGDASP